MRAACCAGPANTSAGPDAAVVAIVGAPNTGKSTLFNSLTGAKVTMGNWPGTTVEVSHGRWQLGDQAVTVIDLPGAYSLDPQSPDEQLTHDLLLDPDPRERPDLTIVLADASRLAHSLYLISQIREHRINFVVALTMGDIAAKRGIEIDVDALATAIGAPVVPTNPRHRTGLKDLAATASSSLTLGHPLFAPSADARRSLDSQPSAENDGKKGDGHTSVKDGKGDACCCVSEANAEERFAWIARTVAATTNAPQGYRQSFSDKVDRVVTAPVVGPLIFLGVMWVVFQITTAVAAPLQDWLDQLFSGPLSDWTRDGLGAIGMGGTWLEGLLVDGLIAGVGALLTFVPLMALMFILLALLEDSGYLGRAALVADRMMRVLGLPGKAFLPFIVGFGCNVPGVAATRILPDAAQRILTCLLVPFTACTARLTVFVMIGTTFFGAWAGTAVFVMYLISIHLIIGMGWLLRKWLWPNLVEDPLVLDLPPYQIPTLRITASVAWLRLKGFLQTASGIIVVTVCAVWLLQSIPADGKSGFGAVEVGDSAYGVAAKAITPVFEPTGFASWETTSAAIVGFVAKEAVISSWAQTYALAEPESDTEPGSLGARILTDFTKSSGGHPIPAALAFMVFLLAYTPCVATLAAQVREIGLKWTLFGVALQLVTAWLLAVAFFQVGRLIA
jgi:ferrous iron transport protein B